MQNTVKEKLRKGLVSMGTWIQLADPSVAEIIGRSGYDWVAVDMEHGHISKQNLPGIFRSLELGNTLPFVRLAKSNPENAKEALDGGARGIIFPNISNAETLRNCIMSIYYPPKGCRGVGYSRANLYGDQFNEYAKYHFDNLIAVAQIEHIDALQQLDNILQVPDLDAIILGPYDLSGSMGITGQFDHPEFRSLIQEINQKSQSHGIPMGIHIVLPERKQLDAKIDEGYQFIAYGTDAVFLFQNAKNPLK